jgi:hypothetical protein
MEEPCKYETSEEIELLSEKSDAKGAPKFKELVERFRKKVASIPPECHTALFYWRMAVYTQENRIALENRLRQTTKIAEKVFWADGLPPEIQATMQITMDATGKTRLQELRKLEEKFTRETEKGFKSSRWFNEVAIAAAEGQGMGPMLAGALLWAIGDAKRFDTFGKFVRYAGLDVTINGAAPKRRRGQHITWNPFLRTTLYKLTEGWNKMPESTWRAMWDGYKEFYRNNRPDLLEVKNSKGEDVSKGKIHNMARRKVQREFLRNLYHLWIAFE